MSVLHAYIVLSSFNSEQTNELSSHISGKPTQDSRGGPAVFNRDKLKVQGHVILKVSAKFGALEICLINQFLTLSQSVV